MNKKETKRQRILGRIENKTQEGFMSRNSCYGILRSFGLKEKINFLKSRKTTMEFISVVQNKNKKYSIIFDLTRDKRFKIVEGDYTLYLK